MTPAEMFARLADVGGYLDGARDRIKQSAEEDWPSKAHPENVWSKGRSVQQFSATVEPDRVVLVNEADYSGHTNDGTTRAGPRTANPYHERGSTDYLDQTADRIVEDEAGVLVTHLGGSSG